MMFLSLRTWSFIRWRAMALAVLAAVGWQGVAFAQQALSESEQEEADTRKELQRIFSEESERAAEAQKALEALDRPSASPEGRQLRNRRQRGARRIVNGMPSRGFPAVGALLTGSQPRASRLGCTGVLVGCDKFLTAAHCIDRKPSPDSYLVFFQDLGFFSVRQVSWEPEKYNRATHDFDLAMLTLASPVEGVAPMAVNTSVRPLPNLMATIVGFGRSGGSKEDYGLKREGSAKLVKCPPQRSKMLCWRYDADVAYVSAQNTCNGDSGGGVFMRDDDGSRKIDKVFAVVTGGADRECVNQDLSFNVDVFEYRDWLASAGEGRLSHEMCSARRWSESGREPVRNFHLDEKRPRETFTVNAPEGAAALRVTMNGEDDGHGRNEFRLSVFKGTDLAEANDACNRNGVGRFAACAIDAPGAGVWTIAADRKKGGGDVQITVLFIDRR